jgi:hypothetical protein
VLEALEEQQGNLAQQVTVQAVAILFFLPSHPLAVAVALLAARLVLEKQAALVAVVVTMAALVVLAIHPQRLQVKATMAEHQMPLTMVAVVVAALLRLVQQLLLPLLVVMVVQVRLLALLVHPLLTLVVAEAHLMQLAALVALVVVVQVESVVALLELLAPQIPEAVGAVDMETLELLLLAALASSSFVTPLVRCPQSAEQLRPAARTPFTHSRRLGCSKSLRSAINTSIKHSQPRVRGLHRPA